jgi:hypothetical protein
MHTEVSRTTDEPTASVLEGRSSVGRCGGVSITTDETTIPAHSSVVRYLDVNVLGPRGRDDPRE